jgi:hypothetical protein
MPPGFALEDLDDYPERLRGGDLTFLPLAFDDGVPVYPAGVQDLAAELRASGLEVSVRHPPEECEFVSDRSTELVGALLEIAVGITSSAGWYALKALLERRSGRARVTVVFEEGDRIRRLKVTGDAAEVAKKLAELSRGSAG